MNFMVEKQIIRLNKGEWSELYAIFYLLVNKKLNIVDHHLNPISNNIFSVKSIIKQKNSLIKFDIEKDRIVLRLAKNKIKLIKIDEIIHLKKLLLQNIINESNGLGSFEIADLNQYLSKYRFFTKFKAHSNIKEDIWLLNLDIDRNLEIELGYSIKSQLGNPSTILNASKHTNIRYIVYGLTNDQINEVNSINTKTKLKDRLARIYKLGGKISFNQIESDTFDKNLKMVDMLLPKVLAEVLLKSYLIGIKDLRKLFKLSSIYDNQDLADKKLADFLMAISFGMFPSKLWNGKYTANGGLIIVAKNSEVYVIDMVYFEEEVRKFLINKVKLDSPSSSRYGMLNLKKENNKVYFTLNLQIRYKS